MGRQLTLAAVAVLLLATCSAGSATAGDPFVVGFSEDLPKEIGAGAVSPAAALGGKAFRLTTLWSPGQTEIPASEATKLNRATEAREGQRLLLAVYADAGLKAPQDDATRNAYCSYIRKLLVAYPVIRDVVIWNEPNRSLFWSPQADAPAKYQQLLARCYDALAGLGANVIGLALSSTGNDNAGSTSPGAFIRGVGEAYRASGRPAPLLDTVGYHPYGLDAAERPWRKHIASKTIALGDWNKLMYNLFLAFRGTAQPIPGEAGVRIWYTEAAAQTAIDPAKASHYTGTENVPTVPDYAGGEPDAPAPAETTPAPDQWTQALDAIRLAACQPYVTAYFNFLLADEPRLTGWQSGPYWADLTRKDSWPAFQQAIGEATAGSVACDALKGGRPSPDFMPPSVPTTFEALPAADGTSVALSWTAATDASPLTYRVYRDGAQVASTSAASWTQTGVTPKKTYAFTVRALDAAGNLGDASAPVTVTTPEPPVPEPPAPAPDPIPTPTPTPPPAGGAAALESAQPSDPSAAPTTPAPPPAPAPAPAPAPVAVTGTVESAGSPAAPSRLRARATRGTLALTWSRSADQARVSTYLVFRDGVLRRSTPSLTFSERARKGRHVYTVRAQDTNGLRSLAARVVVRR